VGEVEAGDKPVVADGVAERLSKPALAVGRGPDPAVADVGKPTKPPGAEVIGGNHPDAKVIDVNQRRAASGRAVPDVDEWNLCRSGERGELAVGPGDDAVVLHPLAAR